MTGTSLLPMLGEGRLGSRILMERQEARGKNGEVFEVNRNGIKVTCRDGIVIIKSLQPEGKRVMSAGEFLSGHNIKKGEILGGRRE